MVTMSDKLEGRQMSALELRAFLRQALQQISEFRRECDPGENVVLVTGVELMGVSAFSEESVWVEFDVGPGSVND